jgi:hypothetical protein
VFKQALRTLTIACLAAVVLVCIHVLPRFFADRAGREAARDAVAKAMQNDVRQIAAEASKSAATHAAADMQKDLLATTMPSTRNDLVVIERAAYSISVPVDSTVDAEDSSIDKEHLTTIDLPDGSTITIVVIDDKTVAGGAYDKAIASVRGRIEDAVGQKSDVFNSRALRSTAMIGAVKGKKYDFDLGEIEGDRKACLIIVQHQDQNKAEAMEVLRRAVGTFDFKG